MILPDVNVLIYAFREDAEQHSVARRWLGQIVSKDETFGISSLSLAAVVRITTAKNFPNGPSSLEDVLAFCRDINSDSRCHLIEPGPQHWPIFTRLCLDTQTTGPRVTDAWYAALAIEHDCEWITFDRDFARFPGLRWRTPAEASNS